MTVTAKVAVEDANPSFDKCYDYGIPAALAARVTPGSLVLVPFGRGRTKPRIGIVLAVSEPQVPVRGLKEICDAAPDAARLTPELLGLAEWLREHTFCTYYEAVRAIIPYGAQYAAVDRGAGYLLEKKLTVQTVTCYSAADETLPCTKKQRAVLNLLQKTGSLPGPVICERADVGAGVLKTMAKNGLLRAQTAEKTAALYENYETSFVPVQLSEEQHQSFARLAARMDEDRPAPALLHGVTGSGKTLVFVELLRKAVAEGKQCLVLVPEIGLTPQMIYRLKSVFGERVAVQHSALSHSERLAQWKQIQAGGADIVVGTRSAVFAPLSRLGLIIVDEEQEHTYTSESSPRYNAVEVAKKRAATHGCLLLLASATPLLDDFYAAKQGRVLLTQLRHRYGNLPLPAVEMVDMRAELAAGNAGSISRELAGAMTDALAAGRQTILLLNRRGYQTVGMCVSCGEVVKCKLCSVPMVYHKSSERLLCHYCGSEQRPVPQLCPICAGKLRYTGFGTQRVEEELAALFPSARILRLDADATRAKNSHEKLLEKFAAGEYDIMIGTQMVAKGLDFPNVSLVGVLGIDQMLFAQSYRAFERVFSLVTQVVGRSGRAGAQGMALIQTVDPENRILNLAAAQDYEQFYEEEIGLRRLNLYPPFCSICLCLFTGEDERETARAAAEFARLLRAAAAQNPRLPLRILGPAPASLSMLAGRYRYKLTIKCRADGPFRNMLRTALEQYHTGSFGGVVSLAVNLNNDCDA